MALTLAIPDEFYDELYISIQKVYVKATEKAREDTILLKTYLSINEITSYYLDVTRPTIMAWIKKGLATYEIEGKGYIKRSELDEFIERHKK